MKKVVVMMSTYNGGHYLREQLDSLLTQQGVNLSIVIRDDGSKDDTITILREYVTAYPSIKILEGKNYGAEMSFHRLCQFASENTEADYYAFCDQDDVWLPNKLITALNHLEKFPQNLPALYFSNLTMVDSELQPIRNLFSPGEVVVSKRMALIQIFTYGCTCVFNYHALIDYCKTNLTKEVFHDRWLFVMTSFLGNVYYDEGSHILYRQHGENISGQKVTGLKLIFQRLKRASKGHWGHSFELSSTMLLLSFKDRLLPEDQKYAQLVANYRKSLFNKLRLLFSRSYCTGHFSKDMAIKIRILTNHL